MKKNVLKQWRVLLLLALISVLFLAGCGSEDADSTTNDMDETEAVFEEDAEDEIENFDEAFPVTITDFMDREITIEEKPESIVSAQVSPTEILFAIGAGDRVVGVTDFDNYPEEVYDIQKIGAQDLNVELILSLLPDLLIATDYHYYNHEDVLKQFEEAGIHVLVMGSIESFDETYKQIEMIGTATGNLAEAEEITADMQERLEVIKEKAAEEVTEKKTVWTEVSPSPDIFTTGQNTFMHEMLEAIQAENAAGETEGWVSFTEEEAVELNPDIIIITYGDYVENPLDEVYGRDGWQEVTAVKEEQVFEVDSDIVTRPGPRLIEGVEILAEHIYPEVFAE